MTSSRKKAVRAILVLTVAVAAFYTATYFIGVGLISLIPRHPALEPEGIVLELVAIPGTEDAYEWKAGFTISPDGRWLAYPTQENRLAMVNLHSLQKWVFPAKDDLTRQSSAYEKTKNKCWTVDSRICLMLDRPYSASGFQYRDRWTIVDVSGPAPVARETADVESIGFCSDCGTEPVEYQTNADETVMTSTYPSPDGRYVAEVVSPLLARGAIHLDSHVEIRDTVTGTVYVVEASVFEPVHWSSDSRRLYFIRDGLFKYVDVPR